MASCNDPDLSCAFSSLFLGNGQLIRSSDLTLGGCAALDAADHILKFQTALQGCGSTMTVCGFLPPFSVHLLVIKVALTVLCLLQMTEEALIYSFSLVYSPTPIGSTFILKTNPAQVVIECHYLR